MRTPQVFKRKKEGVTDYNRRLRLVKSGNMRLVVRPSKKGITAQIVEYGTEGDKVISTITSKSLAKLGLTLSGNTTTACYFIGYALGLNAKKKNVNEAILDTGRFNITRGGRITAVLKGVVDAGIEVPHDPSIFPEESRLRGEHLKNKEQLAEQFDSFKVKLEESI